MKKFLLLACVLAGAPLRGETPPERIVSLLPSHTEVLAVLGALDAVVAVGDAEDPALLPRLPRVGGIEPAWESLVALTPDLILADTAHRRFQPLFERFHLPVAYLRATDARTVEDVFDLIAEVGRLVGRKDGADRWVAAARKRAARLDARRPATPGPRVYFEIWPQPLQACGPRSLPGHFIARSGGQNVIEEDLAAPLISAEAVLKAGPAIVFHTGIVSSEEIRRRPGWGQLKTMRIVEVDQNLFSRAGPRVLDAWEEVLNHMSAEGAR